ncbi:hypothetical protein NV379_14440 [Paenibacillus sp. N1-5-1-14]|uniref:hypothetical protein n=1 Tax=Paenibacillus radicibacter TaxID=2972488 RepID=UPI0021590C09|nr:hypothetical protein [Paenibacillus radicibacter]MCR8643851.1 hypothetical protein [Paenibacillus radicibacter]
MNSNVEIPQGESTILVEMTVKEALSLTGVKFLGDRELEYRAVKKLKQSLEDRLFTKTE